MVDLIKETFGIPFQMREINKIKGLPVYMTTRRSFYVLKSGDNEFLLVKLPVDDKYGVIALKKQMKLYEDTQGMCVAFWFENVTKMQRDSLVQHGIPFVSIPNQLYLPFLGIALKNHFKKAASIEQMMPITQCLFLYMIYKSNGEYIMKTQAADDLHVTKTSITRASEQLVAMNLIIQEKKGKEYLMKSGATGMELYERAKEYLINPIQSVVIAVMQEQYKELPYAGESALSRCTMLNAPEIPIIALDKKNELVRTIKQIDLRWQTEENVIQIELWKYDPGMFMKQGIVDPISLAMTFKDTMDERIDEAIDEYMEGYKW